MGAAAVIGGAALLGGIAGSQPTKTSSSYSDFTTHQLILNPQSEAEAQGEKASTTALSDLQSQLQAIQNNPANARFQSLLQELGSNPSQERIDQSNQFAQQVFAPQQTALNQNLQLQQQQFAARAAQMGRSSADPILAARLAQEQVRQQQMLSSQQGAFAAQEAINAPQRQFQNLAAGVGTLQQQAIQNQGAIFNMGSNLAQQLRQFRLATATEQTASTGGGTKQSGGGFGGAVGGILGGAGAGFQLAQGAGFFTPQRQSRPPQLFNYAGQDSGFNTYG